MREDKLQQLAAKQKIKYFHMNEFLNSGLSSQKK